MDEQKELMVPTEFMGVVEAKKKELLASNPKIKRIVPIIVAGNEEAGEKPYYVAYMKHPDMKAFSKFMMTNGTNTLVAQQNLAKDCFVDGDRELLTDDELFLMGLMPNLNALIEPRNSRIVNF
jgi:hypothetical protein